MSTDDRTWKAKLLAARKLYAGWHKMLHKLVAAIADFWNDAEFRAETGLRDDGQAADWLDAEFPELPLHWLDMLAVYRAYPQPQQWVDARPQDLLDGLRQQAETEGDKAARNRPAWKALYKQLQEEVANLKTENLKLKRENGELRRMLAEAPDPVAI